MLLARLLLTLEIAAQGLVRLPACGLHPLDRGRDRAGHALDSGRARRLRRLSEDLPLVRALDLLARPADDALDHALVDVRVEALAHHALDPRIDLLVHLQDQPLQVGAALLRARRLHGDEGQFGAQPRHIDDHPGGLRAFERDDREAGVERTGHRHRGVVQEQKRLLRDGHLGHDAVEQVAGDEGDAALRQLRGRAALPEADAAPREGARRPKMLLPHHRRSDEREAQFPLPPARVLDRPELEALPAVARKHRRGDDHACSGRTAAAGLAQFEHQVRALDRRFRPDQGVDPAEPVEGGAEAPHRCMVPAQPRRDRARAVDEFLGEERRLLAGHLLAPRVGGDPRMASMVGRVTRRATEAPQRLDRALPRKRRARGLEACGARRGIGVVEHRLDRRRDRHRIVGGDDATEPLALDECRQVVAGGHDHRAQRPDVVERAGAKGELGLDAAAVQAHADVALEQPALPLLVGYPVDERRTTTLDAEFTRERDRIARDRHLADLRVGMAGAQEERLHLGAPRAQQGGRAHQRERIDPVPHATRPEHDAIVDPDARHDAADERCARDRRRLGNPEGHEVDERAQFRVALVVRAVHPPGGGEHAEPERALRLARAQKEVAVLEVVLEPAQREQRATAGAREVVAIQVEIGQHEGIVEVDDAGLLRRGDEFHTARQHDRRACIDKRAERAATRQRREAESRDLARQFAAVGRTQYDVLAAARQGRRHLEGPRG